MHHVTHHIWNKLLRRDVEVVQLLHDLCCNPVAARHASIWGVDVTTHSRDRSSELTRTPSISKSTALGATVLGRVSTACWTSDVLAWQIIDFVLVCCMRMGKARGARWRACPFSQGGRPVMTEALRA